MINIRTLVVSFTCFSTLFASEVNAARVKAELGVTTARRPGGDALVLSPTFGLDLNLARSVKFGGEFGLTSLRADGIDSFQPSNVQLSTLYHGDGYFFGVKGAVSLGAVSRGREQNIRAGMIRGGWDPWLFTPKTSAIVATWGFDWELVEDFMNSTVAIDVASLLPSNGDPMRAAWQLGWDIRMPLLDFFALGARTGLVRPTDRFFGGGRTGMLVFFQPSAELSLGPIDVWASINLPLLGPTPTGIESDRAKAFLFGLSFGR